MRRCDLAVLLALTVFLITPVSAAFVLAVRQDRTEKCANNLSRLLKMQFVYMVQFGGRAKAVPPYTGEAFWLSLTQTQPALIDPRYSEVFRCPVRGKDEWWGNCDYRGPAAMLRGIAGTDPIGADREGNHGPGKGGNVLLASGEVKECIPRDAEWKAAATKTSSWWSARKEGDEPIAALIEGLKDPDPRSRWVAAMKLAGKGALAKEASSALAAPAKEKDFMVRLATFRALGGIGAPAVPTLIGLIQEKDENVSLSAIQALGAVGPVAKEAIGPLQRVIESPSVEAWTRGACAEALGKIGAADPKIISSLLTLLGDSDRVVARGASDGLGHAGSPALPGLIQVLKEGVAGAQTHAAWAVAKLGPPAKDAVPALILLLRSQNEESLWAATSALGSIGSSARDAVPPLRELATTGKGESKGRALQALGRIAPSEAVPVLVKALQDPDPDARYVAAQTLGELGPAAKSARPALAEALKSADEFTKEAIQEALRKIPDR